MNFLDAWLAIWSDCSSIFSSSKPACGTSAGRAFKAFSRRLLVPPAPPSKTLYDVVSRCVSLTISNVVWVLRRLRFTDAPNSSSNNSDFSKQLRILTRYAVGDRRENVSANGSWLHEKRAEHITKLPETSGAIDQIVRNLRSQYQFAEVCQWRQPAPGSILDRADASERVVLQ